MLEKLKKAIAIIKNNYLLITCAIIIINGFLLIDSRAHTYNSSDAKIIGDSIVAGLKILAGSIMIGSSILTLGKINRN